MHELNLDQKKKEKEVAFAERNSGASI